jgi:hypothetical protein
MGVLDKKICFYLSEQGDSRFKERCCNSYDHNRCGGGVMAAESSAPGMCNPIKWFDICRHLTTNSMVSPKYKVCKPMSAILPITAIYKMSPSPPAFLGLLAMVIVKIYIVT